MEKINIEIEEVETPFDFAQIFPGCSATLPVQRILQTMQRHSIEKKQAIILIKNLNYRDEYCIDEFKTFAKAKKKEYHWEIIKNEQLPKKAIRIDFFSAETNFGNGNPKIDDLKNENYLGFCILIPQYCNPNTFRAARALVKIFPNVENYFICKEFPVEVILKTQDNNLTKKTFTIKAFPFQEQNDIFLSCSHVALSTCRWFIKTESGPIKHSEFNKYAKNRFKKDMFSKRPSLYRKRNHGLNGPQISEIASKFSNPLFYSVESKPFVKNLIRLVYRYIRTKIPILLVFETENGLHSIIIIGYIENNDLCWGISRKYYFNKNSTLPDYLSPNSSHEIDWVSDFIIQDNNLGPYLFFPYHKLEWLIKQENAWFLPLFPNGGNNI
jgi:hypothetical protein